MFPTKYQSNRSSVLEKKPLIFFYHKRHVGHLELRNMTILKLFWFGRTAIEMLEEELYRQ